MNYAQSIKDKRKISGDRVLAECEVLLPNSDPFSHYNNLKAGHIVLNTRGGSLYLAEHFNERNIEKIFPNGETTVFNTLKLSANSQPDIILAGLKVKFLRLRKEPHREAIVFRFIDLTEEQLDLLSIAQYQLPAIGDNEESSVPFEEVFCLNRHHGIEDKFQLVSM